jgi:AraC-like DNA-binding protein
MSNKLSPLSPLLFGEESATHTQSLNALGDILENFGGTLNALESTGKQKAFAAKAADASLSDIRIFAWSYTPVYSELCGGYEDRALIHIGFGSNFTICMDGGVFKSKAGHEGLYLPDWDIKTHESGNMVSLSLDTGRLQSTLRAMLGEEGDVPEGLKLQEPRNLPLHQKGLDVLPVIRHLCGLIDQHMDNPPQLEMLGIDDLLYRYGAMMMRPDLFGVRRCSESTSHSLRNRIDGLCEVIRSRLDDKISLTDMERISGLSARSLQYEFSRRFGCSPTQWLRQQRLHTAREKLLSAAPGTSVTRIALELGFSSSSAFASHYRRLFGELPSETIKNQSD